MINLSIVMETFCKSRVNTLVDLMLVWALEVTLFTVVLVKVNWMSGVFVVYNRMCSISVPWLMAICMLMINIDSSMFIVRFLVNDMSLIMMSFCFVSRHFSMDQCS